MSVKILSIEELRDALGKAQDDANAADISLQNVTKDTPEEEVAEWQAKFDSSTADVERLAQALDRKEKMQKAIEAMPGLKDNDGSGTGDGRPPVHVLNEPATYRRGGAHSFFKDVFAATREGDPMAAARLQRHNAEIKADRYAMTTAAGSGVGFVPPQYLQDEWAALARAGRPLADAIGSRALPDVGTSFNIPRVTTGATSAVQATEGAAVQDNSPVTDDVTLSISTIAAKTDMSRQAFDRSQPGLDEVIGQDLAAAYALSVDSEIINGPGSGGRVKGILSAASGNAVAGTTTAVGNYPKIADAIQRIDTNRYLPASVVIMHPRRWAQFLGTLDGSSRPLVVPAPVAANPMAVGGQGSNTSQGFVGYNLQGLPVLKDANIPTNLGAATNEDRIIVSRLEDLYLFESGAPVIRTYEEVLSGTLQVRIQAFGYIAFTAERYVNATYLITGLTPPSF